MMIGKQRSHDRLVAAHGKAAAAWFPDCSVCLTAARTARFDCGHLSTCDTCAEALGQSNGGCPICRQPIGRSLYSEVPPVPGRQPTFESVQVALQRLVKTLESTDSMAQQEAAFALCMRAQEDGNLASFTRLVEAGVMEPLIGLLADSTADAAKACASVTLGLVAPIAFDQVLACGGVPALLRALRRPPVAEYAALALSTLAEQDAPATAAAITATADGYAPLVALPALHVEEVASWHWWSLRCTAFLADPSVFSAQTCARRRSRDVRGGVRCAGKYLRGGGCAWRRGRGAARTAAARGASGVRRQR